jgi:hypothetical protein
MNRYIHSEHANQESGAKNRDNLEALGASNDPGETKNERPHHKDPDYVSDEWGLANLVHLVCAGRLVTQTRSRSHSAAFTDRATS